jgi:molybdopterin/thiamine biosynthesis adenylyltransferase
MTFKIEEDRFERQKLIKNWRQEEIEKARVAVIGNDYLSHFLLAAFAGLGLGRSSNGYLIVCGNGEVTKSEMKMYPLYLEAKEGERKVRALEKMIEKIDSHIQIFGIDTDNPTELEYFLEDVDLIVEASNKPENKKMAIDFVKRNEKLLIDATIERNGYEIFFPGSCRENFNIDTYEQNPIISSIAAGIVTEEIRKIFMPLEFDKKLTLNPLTHKIFKLNSKKRFEDKNLLFVGAGALGNFSILLSSLYGFKIDVFDPDRVEPTNLNRQILFYDSIGKNKAIAIKEKLSKLNPNINAYPSKFDEKYLEKNSPDVIVGNVDNWETRALLNKLSHKYKIPYVDGATEYDSGEVVTFYPNRTKCLNCLSNANKLAEEEIRRGCNQQMPSVVMSNMITAGLMVYDILRVVDPLTFGHPFNGVVGYHSSAPERLFFREAEGVCKCDEK